MAYHVALPGGFSVSDDHDRLDVPMVCTYLSHESYWARGRPSDVMRRAMSNSMCFGVYAAEGRQIGFARVISDFALRAHLNDVFIVPGFRGLGLGKALIAGILDHPRLRNVGTWTLATRDAHSLYAPFGFHPISTPEDQMIMTRTGDGPDSKCLKPTPTE